MSIKPVSDIVLDVAKAADRSSLWRSRKNWRVSKLRMGARQRLFESLGANGSVETKAAQADLLGQIRTSAQDLLERLPRLMPDKSI